MGTDPKPYRVYRGGRTRGHRPLRHGPNPGTPAAPDIAPEGARRPRRRRRTGRWAALALAALVVTVVVWGALSALAVSHGVSEANARLPKGVTDQLDGDDGPLLSTPTTLLVLGTDGGTARPGAARADSIMLVRTDPSHRRLAYLSIPRDLRVEIPGFGGGKITSASQFGGATLALRTVNDVTGLRINHLVLVDFDRFREVIDAVGGIEVDVPAPIRSKKFDCPLKSAAACAAWPGWRFARGRQPMDGRRALVYARIRVNELDPSETDVDRSRRQQQVVQATLDRVVGLRFAARLPGTGDDLVRPLATDLATRALLELGWVAFRADRAGALHCRLGGEPATVGGESVILPSEDNVATIAMFTGRSAPVAPPKGQPYAPGCRVGDAR